MYWGQSLTDIAFFFRIIDQYKNVPEEFDINCVDPLCRSALIAAIENENIELIKLLLKEDIKVKVGIRLIITPILKY